MKIPVMLKNGDELKVDKEQLQSLLSSNQVLCFQRSDGWAFVGYDKLRGLSGGLYFGMDRRQEDSLVAC